jgi:uncharacterized protein DUF6915
MSHTTFHAQSSVRRFGGKTEDYQAIHDWLVLIWTVGQVKYNLRQTQSGAEGTRSSGAPEGMPLEGL